MLRLKLIHVSKNSYWCQLLLYIHIPPDRYNNIACHLINGIDLYSQTVISLEILNLIHEAKPAS